MIAEAASSGNVWVLILHYALLVFVVGFGSWFFVRTIRRNEDPGLLTFKWVLTIVLVTFVLWPILKNPNYVGDFTDIASGGIVGIILAVTWRRSIGNLIATPFANLFDGGKAEYEPRPAYSHAVSLRKKGQFPEALTAVRAQLEKFPTDLEGQILAAEILAENLNDLEGAIISIQRICNQTERTNAQISSALNLLADWYLKLRQDRDSARETLQQIIERFPESTLALQAAQRIASLAGTEHLLAAHDRKTYTVVEGVKNLGLLDPSLHPAPANPDAAKEAGELVRHLQSHPLDGEAREKLAVIYADHYDRMDLATDQLDQIITLPNQQQKRVVHWLNLLADLQIRHGANYDTVRATLQRIVDLFPGTAAVEVAASRINLLKLEFKGRGKTAEVKLGTYEQDIGLKTNRPHR